MRPKDYDATHLVKAVKGLQLHPRSYTPVKVQGVRVEIREANKDLAIEWFAEWAAQFIDALNNGRKILVPIPSSKTVAGSPDDYRTRLIVTAIKNKCGSVVTVAPVLKWRKVMVPSREGGPRDPRALYPELIISGPLPIGKYVLVDDVYTSGGHLTAAAWKLADNGRTVDMAICCGRSMHAQLEDPFSVPDEHLDLAR